MNIFMAEQIYKTKATQNIPDTKMFLHGCNAAKHWCLAYRFL